MAGSIKTEIIYKLYEMFIHSFCIIKFRNLVLWSNCERNFYINFFKFIYDGSYNHLNIGYNSCNVLSFHKICISCLKQVGLKILFLQYSIIQLNILSNFSIQVSVSKQAFVSVNFSLSLRKGKIRRIDYSIIYQNKEPINIITICYIFTLWT